MMWPIQQIDKKRALLVENKTMELNQVLFLVLSYFVMIIQLLVDTNIRWLKNIEKTQNKNVYILASHHCKG